MSETKNLSKATQPGAKKTCKKTKTSSPPSSSGVALQLDILDPSPDGHVMGESGVLEALEDLAVFADVAFLEPLGIALIATKDKPVTLRRHRFVLILNTKRLSDTMGHVEAYAQLVLPGHPVMISIRPVGSIA